jgi:hypothetical protein
MHHYTILLCSWRLSIEHTLAREKSEGEPRIIARRSQPKDPFPPSPVVGVAFMWERVGSECECVYMEGSGGGEERWGGGGGDRMQREIRARASEVAGGKRQGRKRDGGGKARRPYL